MEFNKIYKRTALPKVVFFNQLDKDLTEICADFPELTYVSYINRVGDNPGFSDNNFPVTENDEDKKIIYKIYLNEAKDHYFSIEKNGANFMSGLQLWFYTPQETLMIFDQGGGFSSSGYISYAIFKTKNGFGFSHLLGSDKNNVVPISSYRISNYIFKMKNVEEEKEYFCCYSNSDYQNPPQSSASIASYGYLLKPFNNGIEPISGTLFSLTGGFLYSSNISKITSYGPMNVFANFYSMQDEAYAEHLYIKLCTEENVIGHFTMGGKEFISGSWFALEG